MTCSREWGLRGWMALGPASRSSFAPVISLLELISLLERRSGRCARGRLAIAAFAILLPLPAAVQASAGESTVPAVHHRLPPVLFGPLSHSGLTRMGAAPTGVPGDVTARPGRQPARDGERGARGERSVFAFVRDLPHAGSAPAAIRCARVAAGSSSQGAARRGGAGDVTP